MQGLSISSFPAVQVPGPIANWTVYVAYGSRGMKVHHGRKAWQQVAGMEVGAEN